MKRVFFAAAVLLASGVAQPQARGPSAKEVLEHGQDIEDVWKPQPSFWIGYDKGEEAALQAWARDREQFEKELEAMSEPAVRTRKLAELDAWFRRIPGRFRIEGLIKELENRMGGWVVVSDKVTGVADCTGIGEGVGVQCIFSATWRTIEAFMPERNPTAAMPLSSSEKLRTINPAVLVLGLNMDPTGIRAQMIDAESLTYTWAGQLWENTVWASRVNSFYTGRHGWSPEIVPLQIIAAPDSEVVTIVLRSGLTTITFTMYRDPEARAEEPIKTLRSR